MKKLNFLLVLVFFLSSQFVNSQVAKKIIVEHFTNTKCGVCASRNPGFYGNLHSQPEILHLAIHPSSPYNGCLLYQQNATDNDARTNYYGIYGSTPRFEINGVEISTSADYTSASLFAPYQSQTTPASIRIIQQKFGNDSIKATVIIKTESTHSLGTLSLFVALAEDTVFYTGSNGEPMHFDVFRKSLSNTIGTPVALPATIGDSIMLTFSTPSSNSWNLLRIYTLAILQETGSKNLVQAEAASPLAGAGPGTTSIYENINQLAVKVFPNPTNEFLNVQLNKTTSANITISSIDGKMMLQKQITEKLSQLDISSLPSATYFIKIKTEKGEINQSIIKQ